MVDLLKAVVIGISVFTSNLQLLARVILFPLHFLQAFMNCVMDTMQLLVVEIV